MSAPFMAVVPEPRPGFDAAQLFDGVHWHQGWEVFRGASTPGTHSVSVLCDKTRLPPDLTGKRVLDVGAWNGCFSFECERRGAGEVIAYSLENPRLTGFDRLKAALGSRVEYVQGSVYSLDPEQLGQFDLVLFFGVLYHLRYPLLAIDRLRTVSRGDVLVETHTVTGRQLLRAPFAAVGRFVPLSTLFRTTPIWRQYKEFELHPQDQSNWFGPNVPAVIEAFESAGFIAEHLGSWDGGTRSAFRATATARPARLVSGTYEGVSTFHTHLTGVRGPDPDLFRRD